MKVVKLIIAKVQMLMNALHVQVVEPNISLILQQVLVAPAVLNNLVKH